MSKEIIVAWFGFLGPVVGAVANIINLITAILNLEGQEQEGQPNPKPEAKTQQRPEKSARTAKPTSTSSKALTKLLHIIITTWMLASLMSLLYLVWLPGSENRWFVRIHAILVVVAALSGVAMLVLTTPCQKKPSNRSRELWRVSIKISIFLVFLISFGSLGLQFNDWQKLWPSTRLMTAGFDLFNSEDYKTAITVSRECIDDFHGAAAKVEPTLVNKQFPTGRVTDEEKKAIVDNGVLNDVGACSWITARSMQKLGRPDEARAAYNKTLEYPHARIWDEKGFFWSPAEDAQDRLKDLQ